MFNASKEGIRKALIRGKVALRSPARAITKHILDHSYFANISTPQIAFDLGILLAKGKIKRTNKHGSVISCDMHASKKDMLEDLRNRIKSSRQIYHHKNRNRISLVINSPKWVIDLRALGFEAYQFESQEILLSRIDPKLHKFVAAGIKATEQS